MVAKTGVTPHIASTDDELGHLSDVVSPGLHRPLIITPRISILIIIVMMIATIKPDGEV